MSGAPVDDAHRNPYTVIWRYAGSFPWPLRSRAFASQCTWREFEGDEYALLNRHATHPSLAQHSGANSAQKYVFGRSHFTGNYIRPLAPSSDASAGGGTRLIYVSHTDPGGNIPKWLVNSTLAGLIPDTMRDIERNAARYSAWVRANKPLGWRPPWRTPAHSWRTGLPRKAPAPTPQAAGDLATVTDNPLDADKVQTTGVGGVSVSL